MQRVSSSYQKAISVLDHDAKEDEQFPFS